jgi:quercetin dioxygenase-like cupin family protein
MLRSALATSLALFCATAFADPKAGDPKATPPAAKDDKPTPPDVTKTGAILLVPSDLHWVADPKRPGTAMALAEGDPDKGPAHFYLKYDKGWAGGLHYHSNDHGGWILSGTVILVVDGKETKLPPGSFYFMKAKKPHLAKCDTDAECVMTVDVRGTWDAVPVKADAPPAKK